MNLKNIDKTHFQKLTVLYVEDDPATREEVAFFLEMLVGKLYVAKNGREGLELFYAHEFDMVITDIQMPVMNGLDMVKLIRDINKTIPIAVTTAFSDTEFLMKSIECGVDKYILKPIDIQEMTTIIQKCTNYKILEKKLEACDKYTQFILDQNATFMFIVHDNELDVFKVQMKDMFDAEIELENNQLEKIYTTLNDQKQFTLSYQHFEEIHKSAFVFKEMNEAMAL